jgi:FlgD Ig-like domain
VRIGGTDTTAAPDHQGPAIHLYLDSRTFRSGDVVSGNPLLIVDLEDENGINTSGAGVGHRLEAWLDNAAQSVDLSNYYKSKIDTYREGTIEYSLGTLSYGNHALRVRAWDTHNNPSTSETVFDVMTAVGLKISNLFNYPNPFRSSTVFTFDHNQLSPIEAEVKIFTVAGRLIRSLKEPNITASSVRIPWDGRDADGDILANGVYLYKVITRTLDGRLDAEAYGKMSILR